MMPRACAATLVGLAVCGAGGCTPRVPDPASDGAVREHLIRYYDALSARDWPLLPASFWPDATLTTIWQPPGEPAVRVWTTTVPAFIAAAPDGPGSQPIFEERPVSIDIRSDGRLASAWVRYHARFGAPGALVCWTGTDLFTLLRHDGEWRIASVAYVSDGTGAAPDDCG